MKDLFIHIGTPKTGTSAFQQYLFDNTELLSKKGVTYFTGLISDPYNNHGIFFNILKGYKATRDQAYVSGVVQQIAGDPHETGILSAEGLSFWITRINGFRYFIKRLQKSGITCRLIVVIRHPLDYLISAYGEDVFAGNCSLDFWEWLDSRQGRGHKKVIHCISRWESLVGVENIRWLAYEPDKDFPHRILTIALGQTASFRGLLQQKPALLRKSPNGSQIEIYRRINALLPPKYPIQDRLAEIEIASDIPQAAETWA